MAIVLRCDNRACGKSLRVKDELAGKRINCPACGHGIVVPATADRTGPSAGTRPPHSDAMRVERAGSGTSARSTDLSTDRLNTRPMGSPSEAVRPASRAGSWVSGRLVGAFYGLGLGMAASFAVFPLVGLAVLLPLNLTIGLDWPVFWPVFVGYFAIFAVGGIAYGLTVGGQQPRLSWRHLKRAMAISSEREPATAEMAKAVHPQARTGTVKQPMSQLDLDIQRLLTILRDNENQSERRSAAEALGKTRDPRAVSPLIRALRRDPAKDVRYSAAFALGCIGHPRAVEALIAALRDVNGYVRCGAADALGSLRDGRAVKHLIPLLGDENSQAREAAIAALKRFMPAEEVAALASTAKQKPVDVSRKGIVKDLLLQFLTSERTKQYEAEHDAHWSLRDMVLVITSTGMHRDWADVNITGLVVDALAELYQHGRITLNSTYAPSKDVRANTRFIRELQTEVEPLFRARQAAQTWKERRTKR